jgi:hypothetical protein
VSLDPTGDPVVLVAERSNTISNGLDVQAIAEVFITKVQERIARHGFSEEAVDFADDEMNRLFAKLPSEPEEELR